jgi:hypothetical protein
VVPRPGLDDVEKRKFLTPPGLELRPLGRPARNQVSIPTTLSRQTFSVPMSVLLHQCSRSRRKIVFSASAVHGRDIRRDETIWDIRHGCKDNNARTLLWVHTLCNVKPPKLLYFELRNAKSISTLHRMNFPFSPLLCNL